MTTGGVPTEPGAGWVTARTGAALTTDREVALLALRRNPKRAHLLVSTLLGKHLPVTGDVVLSAAAELGAHVRGAVTATPFVIGFAETATGLGHGVARVCSADGGQAPYAHTTRRPVPAGAHVVSFEEEHSHAVEQVLAVLDDTLLRDPSRPVVLVDDELSSGRTAVNAIRVLQRRWPRRQYVLASLLDVRTPAQRLDNAAEVAGLGAELSSVSLVDGSVQLPADLPSLTAGLLAEGGTAAAIAPGPAAPVTTWALTVAGSLTGAFGWGVDDEEALRSAVALLADRLQLPGSVLVLGDEEFLYPGQLLAQALGQRTRTSSTTRSPALVVDQPGYPLRTVLRFAATDDAGREAFAYNVVPSRQLDRGPAPGFDHVVLLLDRPVPPHHRDGLLRQLSAAATTSVQLVLVDEGGAVGAVRCSSSARSDGLRTVRQGGQQVDDAVTDAGDAEDLRPP